MIGVHFIFDLYDCENIENFNDAKANEEFYKNLLIKANLNLVSFNIYQFPICGLSGSFIISESHLSFHTWCEEKFVSVDLFSCNLNVSLDLLKNELILFYKPKKVIHKKIIRGKLAKKLSIWKVE